MTDFTRNWIAKREQLEGVLSAYDSLVDTCGDLTAAVAVGQLRVSDLLAEARADARTSLPAALAALKAVLELHYASPAPKSWGVGAEVCGGSCGGDEFVPYPCLTVATIEAALWDKS